MFTWNHKIYMDDKVSQKPIKYRRIIERKKIVRKCYCITLPVDDRNCMDIYSSRELWFSYQRALGLEVIGLAADEFGAMELVERIAKDVYAQKGDVNSKTLHEYFDS